MNSKDLIEKLKAGEKIYGTAIVSPSAMWPSVVKNAGLDFVFIDNHYHDNNMEGRQGCTRSLESQ